MEKISVRRAKARDLTRLNELWSECFPDDVNFRQFFFKALYDARFAYVCETDGVVCAMLHAFPFTFSSPDGKLKAKYVYGVGTGRDFRGIGAASRLLNHIENDCDFLVLIPQSRSLFDFYARSGYCAEFFITRTDVTPEGEIALTPAKASDIGALDKIYEQFTDGLIHPERTPKHWETTLQELSDAGGGIALFDGGYCAYYKDGDRAIISEIFPKDDSVIRRVAGALNSPCTVLLAGSGEPFGAAKLLTERAKAAFSTDTGRYLNLMHN